MKTYLAPFIIVSTFFINFSAYALDEQSLFIRAQNYHNTQDSYSSQEETNFTIIPKNHPEYQIFAQRTGFSYTNAHTQQIAATSTTSLTDAHNENSMINTTNLIIDGANTYYQEHTNDGFDLYGTPWVQSYDPNLYSQFNRSYELIFNQSKETYALSGIHTYDPVNNTVVLQLDLNDNVNENINTLIKEIQLMNSDLMHSDITMDIQSDLKVSIDAQTGALLKLETQAVIDTEEFIMFIDSTSTIDYDSYYEIEVPQETEYFYE